MLPLRTEFRQLNEYVFVCGGHIHPPERDVHFRQLRSKPVRPQMVQPPLPQDTSPVKHKTGFGTCEVGCISYQYIQTVAVPNSRCT